MEGTDGMLARVIKVLCLSECLNELLSCNGWVRFDLLDSRRGGQIVDGMTQRKWHDIPCERFQRSPTLIRPGFGSEV